MSGFDAGWLSLREPADMRARNADIADALQGHFGARESISVVDIGCGTGSNLRGLAELLPPRQTWRLVDYDDELLIAAGDALGEWADEAKKKGEHLELRKGSSTMRVELYKADLANRLEDGVGEAGDLITAAAFFDLASADFIRSFAKAVAARRAVFCTVLTYNGQSAWTPRHPLDQAVTALFHKHQMSDKGFGPAAGPTAPAHLADQFRMNGYGVHEGDSPWRLSADDAALIGELHAGYVQMLRETAQMDEAEIKKWAAHTKTGAVIGHTDTLAIPEVG